MLKSDLVFMTKEGLQQLEEVMTCRTDNLYRNRKVPVEHPLSYKNYIGEYTPKSRQDPDYTEIIKPTLEHESLKAIRDAAAKEVELEIFTPSIQQYMEDLKKIL